MRGLGISVPTLELMSLIVLRWGHRAWKESRDATWVRMDAMPSCPGSMRRTGGDTDASTRTGGSKRRYLAARPPQPVGSGWATGRQGRPVRASGISGRGRHRPEPAGVNGVVPRIQWWKRVGIKTGAELGQSKRCGSVPLRGRSGSRSAGSDRYSARSGQRSVSGRFGFERRHSAHCLRLPSQMPRHLISDAHEWINEIPTVPIYYLAKPQPRERAWQNQRGKKTLLSLIFARLGGWASPSRAFLWWAWRFLDQARARPGCPARPGSPAGQRCRTRL